MPRSFSVEKRWAMVYKREVLGLSYETIQEQLEDYDSKGPSPKTIRRMVKLFRSTGGVEDRQGQRHPGQNNIVYDTQLSQKLVDIVLDSPESPLDAIKDAFENQTGVLKDVSSICRALKKLGFTRKKVCCGTDRGARASHGRRC